VVADAQFPLQQVADVDEKLRIQWINAAAAKLHWIERLEAVDDWLVQAKPLANGSNGILRQARIANARSCRITWQNAEQEKVKQNDNQNGEQSPADLLEEETGLSHEFHQ